MATRKPKILITGATGQVGHEVLKRLTDDKALDVAASSRAPAKAADLGVPVVLLDYDRRETIAPALEGVDRLFILTAYTVDMLRQSKALVPRKSGVKHIVHLGAFRGHRTPPSRGHHLSGAESCFRNNPAI